MNYTIRWFILEPFLVNCFIVYATVKWIYQALYTRKIRISPILSFEKLRSKCLRGSQCNSRYNLISTECFIIIINHYSSSSSFRRNCHHYQPSTIVIIFIVVFIQRMIDALVRDLAAAAAAAETLLSLVGVVFVVVFVSSVQCAAGQCPSSVDRHAIGPWEADTWHRLKSIVLRDFLLRHPPLQSHPPISSSSSSSAPSSSSSLLFPVLQRPPSVDRLSKYSAGGFRARDRFTANNDYQCSVSLVSLAVIPYPPSVPPPDPDAFFPSMPLPSPLPLIPSSVAGPEKSPLISRMLAIGLTERPDTNCFSCLRRPLGAPLSLGLLFGRTLNQLCCCTQATIVVSLLIVAAAAADGLRV